MQSNIRTSFVAESQVSFLESTEMALAVSRILVEEEPFNPSAAKTLALIPPEIALLNQSIPVRLYELDRYLASSRSQPNLSVLSGSGLRVDEILALNTNGRKNILSADPHPDYSTENAIDGMELFNLPYTRARKSRQIRYPFNGIVLTDDTHEELFQTFAKHKIDELLICRLDPDSLLPRGSIDDARRPEDLAQDQVKAVCAIVRYLGMLSDRGEATITIGMGNSAHAYLFRRAIIYSLLELGKKTGIEIEHLGSPWLELFFKRKDLQGSDNPLQKAILSTASLDAIRIHGSSSLRNLPILMGVRYFQPTLRDCLSAGLEKTINDDLVRKLGLID